MDLDQSLRPVELRVNPNQHLQNVQSMKNRTILTISSFEAGGSQENNPASNAHGVTGVWDHQMLFWSQNPFFIH